MCVCAAEPSDPFILQQRGAEMRHWRRSSRQKQWPWEREIETVWIRCGVREIRTLPQESQLNSSTPCMVKISPQKPRDRLGSWVSMNHGAMGIVDQTTACMNDAVKDTNKLRQPRAIDIMRVAWRHRWSSLAWNVPTGSSVFAHLCYCEVVNYTIGPLLPDASTHHGQQPRWPPGTVSWLHLFRAAAPWWRSHFLARARCCCERVFITAGGRSWRDVTHPR